MKKIYLLGLISLFAIQLTFGQTDDNDFEKGQLVPVSKYYGVSDLDIDLQQKGKVAPFSAIYSEDFEGNTDDWSFDGIWGIGNPQTGPEAGNNSTNAAGTNLSGLYSASVSDTLISPTITLTADASEDIYLEFYEWFELESNHDYGFVIISTDGGENWTTLHERSGQSDWVLNHISLNNYKGEDVKIGFMIDTDDSVEFEGWYVDDVSIITRPENELGANISSLNSRQFPFIYLNVEADTFGTGISSLEQENFEVTENGVVQEDYFQVIPPEEGGQVRLADIVFIMDNSGSMGPYQDAVEDNVFDFVDSLGRSGVDYSLGLTRYGAVENNGNPIFTNSGNLTSDTAFFKNQIWSQNVQSGGFEPGYQSIVEAISNFSYRPGAQKIFIIITDETPTQGSTTLSDAQQALEDNSGTLFALTTTSLYDEFEPLVDDPDEQIFNIFDPFEDILDFIVETVSDSYVVRYRSSEPVRDGVRRHVQVELNYDGRQALDNTSYIPGSAPDVKRTRNTIVYGTQAWAEGTPFDISVEVRDEVEPFPTNTTLHYRTTGESEYTELEMEEGGDGMYTATIPSGFASRPGIDYYITTTDGGSSTSAPRSNPSENPYQIPILPNRAPDITHTPVVNTEEDESVTIEAIITDETNELSTVTLFYREFGQLTFTSQEMDYEGNDRYQQVIPAEFVTAGGVEYYIQAEDDLGLRSWAPESPDDPAFISTGNVISVDFTSPENGPRARNITVPENGSAYIYYELMGDEPISYDESFSLALTNTNSGESYSAQAEFIRENLIQIEVVYNFLEEGPSTTFELEDNFNIDTETYELDSRVIFTAVPTEQSFSRTWSIYASGSAGVSGTIGVGAGSATVAAAKASISGNGGVGLAIQSNQNGDLAITRKMDVGVASSVSVPAFSVPLVDQVKPGLGGNLMVKAMTGHTVNFSQINDADIRSMAQAGYMLETLSLGGAAISPKAGLLLKATVNTINSLGNVNQELDQAISERFGGIGLEGSIKGGIDYNFRGLEIRSAEASSGFVLNANYYQYPLGLQENNSITSSAEITSAFNFDLEALNWDLGIPELSNFAVGSGSEIGIAGYWQDNGGLDHVAFSLTNGADLNLNSLDLERFQTTTVEIPAAYFSNLTNINSALAGFVDPNNSALPFGSSVAESLNNDFNTLANSVQNNDPISVTTIEKRGRGFEFDYTSTFDASFGVGAGIEIGLGLELFDEVSFPRSHMEVYADRQNYIVSNSTYSQSMRSQQLQDVLTELFSGTIPLVEEAWSNLVTQVENTIQAGTDFVVEVTGGAAETIGSIRGSLQQAGQFISSTYSPRSARIQQKGFNAPEIRNAYTSPNVFYPVKGKTSGQQLINAGSELIVIGEVLNLTFIPEGSTTPITTLPSAVELQMEIKEQDLIDNDFTVNDTSKVKIYRYDLNNNGWVLVGGALDEMMLSADITELGEFALGIEISQDNDTKKPEIYDFGYKAPSANTNPNQIYANIRDDRYGSGIDFSNTYMFLNDDTLNYTYQPDEGRMFYELSDSDNLSGETEIVRVEVADFNGNVGVKSFTFEAGTTVDNENEGGIPEQFELLNNYPNPFNPQTNIQFKLPKASDVQINIYDVLGRYVETLLNERVEAGTHTVTWEATSANGQHLSTGIYFYQIKAGEFNQVKKMMFVK